MGLNGYITYSLHCDVCYAGLATSTAYERGKIDNLILFASKHGWFHGDIKSVLDVNKYKRRRFGMGWVCPKCQEGET